MSVRQWQPTAAGLILALVQEKSDALLAAADYQQAMNRAVDLDVLVRMLRRGVAAATGSEGT